MGLVYLVDTNIVSEIMRARPNPQVVALWETHYRQIAMASVTWHELWLGVQMDRSKKRQVRNSILLQSIKQALPILPYDEIAAYTHALEKTRLIRSGVTPAHLDGQIASIAITQALTLVTRNTKDFQHFNQLHLENWFNN